MRNYTARSRQLLLSILLGASSCSLLACSLFEPESHWKCSNPDCSPVDSGKSAMDGGGRDSGSDASPSGSSDTGSGGSGAGSGGAGNSSTCTNCNADQVCDESNGQCVECIGNDDCKPPRPACTIDHRCVACTLDRHCPSSAPACSDDNICVGCTDSALHCSGKTPLCDVAAHECVQCLKNTDCTDPTASRCSNGTCKSCTGPLHCKHLDGLSVCDTSSGTGECVQCTGTSYDACGSASGGKPYVCDTKAKTCTTKEAGIAEPCQPCVSDAQCRTGTACMQTTFGPSNVQTGNLCLWKQDATGSGAPNGDCLNARPYVGTESSWKSIDGDKPTVCKPARTTCQAQNDFLNKSCSGETPQGNAECGAEGVDDAYCAAFGSEHRCTVPCVSFDDCKDTRPSDDMECQSQNLGGQSIDACVFQ